MVNRWLAERGKDKLIAERATFVRAAQAENRRRRFGREIQRVSRPAIDGRRVSLTLARHAAQFLRLARNGGWIISPTPQGDWWVGARRRSAAQLVELALSKGFIANLSDAFGDG